MQLHRDRKAQDLNASEHVYQLALQEAAALRAIAVAKFDAYEMGRVLPANFGALSMAQWAAARLGVYLYVCMSCVSVCLCVCVSVCLCVCVPVSVCLCVSGLCFLPCDDGAQQHV